MDFTLFYLGLMLAAASKAFAHPEPPGPTANYMYFGPALELPIYKRPEWMAPLSNTQRLRELTIIGTHDSASSALATPPNLKCQMLSILDQLEYGIRFLDIKLRQLGIFLFADELNLVDFEIGVLKIVNEFVRTHPTETVLIRISARDPGGRIIPDVYNEYISGYRVEGIWYANHADPFLGQVRGKMVMLDNWSSHKTETHHEYGLGFKSRIFTVQEEKTMAPDTASRYAKFVNDRISWYIPALPGNFKVSFVSDESDVLQPWQTASGHQTPSELSIWEKTPVVDLEPPTVMIEYPRVPSDCELIPPMMCDVSYEGLNTLAYRFMPPFYVGIAVFDFPGHGLITKFININSPIPPNRHGNLTGSQ